MRALIVLMSALALGAGPLPHPTGGQKRLAAELAAVHRDAYDTFRAGDPVKALPLVEKALVLGRGLFGERHLGHVEALENVASVRQAMGEYKAALGLRQRALEIRTGLQGERHPGLARALTSLGNLHAEMGDHSAALPLLRRAVAVLKGTPGERHPSFAACLDDLASLYRAMGDSEAALPVFTQAVALRKELLGARHPDYASSLFRLASLHADMGDNAKALPLLEEAARIFKEVFGARHPRYAEVLRRLAAVHTAKGDHKAALPLYHQSLKIRKEVLGERHPDYATGLNNLALLHADVGDLKAALPLLQQATAISKDILGERHPSYAAGLNNLAALHQKMGDTKAALPLAERALAITLARLHANSAVESDRQQFASAGAMRHFLDMRLSLMDAGGHAHALAWKGSLFLRQRHRRFFSAHSADPLTRKAAEDLQGATRRLAALSASATPSRERLEELTAEQERLQAELSRLSADARAAFKGDRMTPEALSASLPEGAALVDLHFYSRSRSKGKDGKAVWERHLVAFVSRKGAPAARVDLGTAPPVEEAVAAWRAFPDDRDAARRLRLLVWSPLAKHLVGAKHLLISPDGVLGAVPFAALPGTKAGSYLIEESPVTMLPMSRSILDARTPAKGASLLIVAGSLPAARGEAKAVADSFLPDRAVTSLDGRGATREAVGVELAKATHAHFATGGFFHPAIRSSALDGGLFGREAITGWHPLLLSGLTLADDDLTALEVAEMDLSGMHLAVLAGCDTALGKEAAGEGTLGLSRAFHVAGCRTVVAALWGVPDRETATLMGRFHRNLWGKKMPRGEALRAAQLSLLREGKPPHAWAGWVLSGDWR